MNTALLKQNVQPRHDRQNAPRFKLIVNGRVKGVWEKKDALLKSVPLRKESRIKDFFGSAVTLFQRHRVPFIAAIFCALLVAVLAVVFSLRGSGMKPLELPVAAGILRSSFEASIASVVAESDSGDANPLSFRNMTTRTYTVKKGESLSDIARKAGLDLDTIISFNNITDALSIKSGRTLILPNRKGLLHMVKKGDTLGKISRQYRVSFDDLLDWNNLQTSVIAVGQKLFIPGAKLSLNEVNRVLGKLFIWPTRGQISSYFGMRISPITGMRHFHNGIDIFNVPLTPIVAAMAGRVAMVDFNQTYGNYVIIAHADGFQTLYAHCETVSVKKGQQVAQGAKIAAMGTTGASTGYHLHFSIFKNGTAVDPMKYLK